MTFDAEFDADSSTVKSPEIRRRKRKRSSGHDVDSKTSVKTSDQDGRKERHKDKSKERKSLHKDSAQSIKDDKRSVAVTSGCSKKAAAPKKMKRKQKQKNS